VALIQDIKIYKNMSNNDVNEVFGENMINLKLLDDEYLGSSYRHNWLCECGNSFTRVFNHIRIYNQTNCGCIRYKQQEQRYKYEVEKDGEYEYIRSFRSGDRLPNGKVASNKVYLQVKHKYCGSIYEVGSGNFINSKSRCQNCCGSYKDSIAYTHPEISKMIIHDEHGYNIDNKLISRGTSKRFYFKCSQCGKISSNAKKIKHVVNYGYSCEHCSDGISVPEKFVRNILQQLNVDVKFQYNELNSSKIRYDFYIPSLNMIIETHGMQHYEDKTMFNNTLYETQQNDIFKRDMATTNKIQHYIEIDCRYSSLEWLMKNVIKELTPYFDLSRVDFDMAFKESQNSLVVKSWKLWDDGYGTGKIANILGLSNITVTAYLKRYENYSKEESYKRKSDENHYNFKSYIIREDLHGGNIVKYCGIKELSIDNFNAPNIYECCNGKRNNHKDFIWYREGDFNRRRELIEKNKNTFTTKEKEYRRNRVKELKYAGLSNGDVASILSEEMNMKITPRMIRHDINHI